MMDKIRVVGETQLIRNVEDPNLDKDVRIASALVLLRDFESTESHLAALNGFSLNFDGGGMWEDGMSLCKYWPVAFAVSYHPELMPPLVKGVVSGTYKSETFSTVVLEQYRIAGPDPRTLLLQLRDSANNPDERQRCDGLLGLMASKHFPKLEGEEVRDQAPKGSEIWAMPKKMLEARKRTVSQETAATPIQAIPVVLQFSTKPPEPSPVESGPVAIPKHSKDAGGQPLAATGTETSPMWIWATIPFVGLTIWLAVRLRHGKK